MHICYAADDNFSMQTCVSMLSLLTGTASEPMVFHLLDAGVSDANYSKMAALANRYGAVVNRYNVRPFLEKIRQAGQKGWGDFPTHATWARLFLPEILPKEVERILYLDGDVIGAGPLQPLYTTDLHGFCVAGAEDCVSRQYKAELGFGETEPYMNAGVLLFDLAAWRRQYHFDWPRTFLTGRKAFAMADQDVMNLMFRGNCALLPLRYNYSSWFRALDLPALRRLFQSPQLCRYTRREQADCRNHAVLIHYNSCSLLVRPWYCGCTDPAGPMWLRCYEKSEWRDVPLPEEPPRLNPAERKDRRLYQTVGRRWFSVFHTGKRFLNSLYHRA